MRNLVFSGEGKADVFDIIFIIFECHIQENVLHCGERKDALHDAVKVGFIQCGNLRAEGFNRPCCKDDGYAFSVRLRLDSVRGFGDAGCDARLALYPAQDYAVFDSVRCGKMAFCS